MTNDQLVGGQLLSVTELSTVRTVPNKESTLVARICTAGTGPEILVSNSQDGGSGSGSAGVDPVAAVHIWFLGSGSGCSCLGLDTAQVTVTLNENHFVPPAVQKCLTSYSYLETGATPAIRTSSQKPL